MNIAVDAQNVVKYYKTSGKIALDELNLKVSVGSVCGILGPNGAGKSTLLKAAIGLISINSGKIAILGKKPLDAAHLVGYVPDESMLYHYLTGMDILQLVGGLRGLAAHNIKKQVEKYQDIFELPDLNQLIATYSKGNKQKILFMSALLHNPKLLILDEPFTGLDPLVTSKVKTFIKNYSEEGNTVLFSTHILELANTLCHEIAILISGQIIEIIKEHNMRQNCQQLEAWYTNIVTDRNSR